MKKGRQAAIGSGSSYLGWAALFLMMVAGCAAPGQFIIPETKGLAEKIPSDSLKTFRLYLIGDAGYAPLEGKEPTLRLLEDQLAREDSSSAVVFLGDNAYPSGLPPLESPSRPLAEHRIDAQLAAIKNFKGEVLFIPGNHDWGNEGMGGSPATLRRQEVYIEREANRGNIFLPDRAFPGPVDVEVGDDVVVVALDTQWWLEDIKTYGNTGQYELENEGEFLLELNNVLQRHVGKNLIIVAHHPIFSNGSHGGRFAWRRWLLSPLIVFSRAYLGTPQDLSNLRYRRLKEGMQEIFNQHPGLVYAAGHEHDLQYFLHRQQHYIVSGSGSKLDDVFPGYGAAFVEDQKGYATITYYADGSQWLEFIVPNQDGSAGERVYLSRMKEGSGHTIPKPEVQPEDAIAEAEGVTAHSSSNGVEASGAPRAPYAFATQGTVVTKAGEGFRVGGLAKTFLGSRYRDIWEQPIEVPVIDLARTAGGLTPLQKGGGLQTLSLRMEGRDGDEYVLRSVNKDPTKSIPEFLRRTIAQDVVRDQVSAVHPYGALPVPRMEDALGIFHTAPRLVSVPDDERLGKFRPLFSGMLAQFETRPNESQTDEPMYDNAQDIVGTPKLIEEIEQDNDRRVDERAWVRARLLDMLIGDWDRHADQWRWAEYQQDSARTYKPIPRDRDFAFFRFNGLFAKVAHLSGIQNFRRYTNFTDQYGDLFGLNYNGSPLDRRFTTRLVEEDWIEIADSMRTELTDEVIDEALRDWPEAVYKRQGKEFLEILKARRDQLPSVASQYYKLISHTVDVVGSNKHERFEVDRFDDSTRVIVYKTKKEGDVTGVLYSRTFVPSETEEIQLYGLDGNDQFIIRGDVRRGMRVRAIGGGDEDIFVDSSRVYGPAEMTSFYDTEEGNVWLASNGETSIHRSNKPGNNEYRMRRPERSYYVPSMELGYNSDDGLLIGAGVQYFEPGFRKTPYASMYRARARYGIMSQRFDADLRARLIDRFRAWDLGLAGTLRAEREFDDFYGLGNETSRDANNLYRAGIGRVILNTNLEKQVFPFTTVGFGPRFEFTDVDPLDPLMVTNFSARDLRDTYFAGGQVYMNVIGTDTLAATQSGVRWLNSASLNVGVRTSNAVYARLASELSYFYTVDRPVRSTLAVRLGGAANIGDFFFYQANTLGGRENLRGYKRTRFAGRSSFYSNVDLRLKLFEFNAYISRGDGGLLLFTDNGRVWADNDPSRRWHHSVGGGVWLSPFYQTVITATVGASGEETLFDVRFGFLF